MWHENDNEMLQLLKSIMRLDIDQSKKRKKDFDVRHSHEVFDYEAHIFFDDAISYLPNGSSEPNAFVQQFTDVIKDAVM
jgi:chitin synthase